MAPSTLLKWRARYYELINPEHVGTPGVNLLDTGELDATADLVAIPEAAQAKFSENWQQLLEATAATPETFHQPSWRLFLENSWLTSWVFTEGRLDRSILAGAVSAVVGLTLTGSFLLHGTAPQAPPPTEPEPVTLRDDEVIAKAAVAAKAFFAASGQEERLKFVRNPHIARGQMQAYYANHADTPLADGTLTLGMTSRNVTSLSFEFASIGRSHFVNVISDKAGDMKIDWETSSLYQETHLEDLRKSKSTTPTRISVSAEADEYWNYHFADPSQWVCFRLSYPGVEGVLYGYAAAGSREAITLSALTSTSGRPAVVLEVKFPPESQTDNQVQITAVLAEEWVQGS